MAEILRRPFPAPVLQTIFEFLLEEGFSPNLLSLRGLHPLFMPVLNFRTDVVEAVGRHFDLNLIPEEPSPDHYPPGRPSLLSLALSEIRGEETGARVEEMIRLLVSLGANPHRGTDLFDLRESVGNMSMLVPPSEVVGSARDLQIALFKVDTLLLELQSRQDGSSGTFCAGQVH